MSSTNTGPSATRSIVVEHRFPEPPETVWRALTEPELVASWLMPNDLRAEVGHRFTFRATPVPGWDGVVHCEMLAVEPHRRLRFSWRGGSDALDGSGHALDTVVTWTLTPQPDGGTVLRLDHEGFAPDAFAFGPMSEGWDEIVTEQMPRVLAALR